MRHWPNDQTLFVKHLISAIKHNVSHFHFHIHIFSITFSLWSIIDGLPLTRAYLCSKIARNKQLLHHISFSSSSYLVRFYLNKEHIHNWDGRSIEVGHHCTNWAKSGALSSGCPSSAFCCVCDRLFKNASQVSIYIEKEAIANLLFYVVWSNSLYSDWLDPGAQTKHGMWSKDACSDPKSIAKSCAHAKLHWTEIHLQYGMLF